MLAENANAASGRRLITSDSHWAPPLQLADELPAKYRGEVPHIEERSDGLYFVRPRQGITDEFNWRERRIEPGEEDRLATGASPGAFPTRMLPSTMRFSRSITDTLLEPELAT